MVARAPLQRLPKGLLGFMELKNGGQFPQELAAAALIPQIDLLRWYLATNGEPVVTAPIAAAVGFTNFPEFLIPQDEIWYVDNFMVRSELVGAGEAVQLCAGALLRTGARIPFGQIGNNAGPGQIANTTQGIGMFLQPGDQLGADVLGVTGAVNVTGHALITRCQV